jgi:hypothetical protein
MTIIPAIYTLCTLITPQLITDGYCNITNKQLNFESKLDDSVYTATYPLTNCTFEQSKTITTSQGTIQHTTKLRVKCR